MPLLDHFHPPIAAMHGWESFLCAWAVRISDSLNRQMPERYIAGSSFRLGDHFAQEVLENAVADGLPQPEWEPAGGTRVPLTFPDVFAVRVRDRQRDFQPIAVVELVNPTVKCRRSSRAIAAGRCAGYLETGVAVVLLDIVTSVRFNLHNALVRTGGHPDDLLMPDDVTTYASAYRPASTRAGTGYLDVWAHPLAVGDRLPTVPLALWGFGCVPIDLEATYTEACVASRLP